MNNNLVVNVLLECFLPNPWQPRESEDAEHIKKIALSIAQDGLMQVPVGRWVDAELKPAPNMEATNQINLNTLLENGYRVQLAFGHSRLAAFKWLEDVKNHSDLVGNWALMPVVVRDLSDDEMFRMAVGENLARKDLTAIEEARAMARYRDEFGKNSAQIGEVFGVSESTVRGKMRLLNLPAEVQAASRELSEGTMRELLFLFDLPEEVREKMKAWGWTAPDAIVKGALGGTSTGEISRTIDSAVDHACSNMGNQLWKVDDVFAGEGIRGMCEGCPMRFRRNNTYWCGDRSCFMAKMEQFKGQYLAQASLLSGIPAEPSWHSNSCNEFRWESGKAELAAARGARCDNLRLVFAATEPHDYDAHSRVDGWPRAEIVCSKSAGHCTCKKAVEVKAAEQEALGNRGDMSITTRARMSLAAAQAVAAENLDQEDLREIALEAKRRKKEDLGAAKRFAERGKDKIFVAMAEQNPVVWRELVVQMDYSARNRVPMEAGVGAAWLELATWLAKRIYNPENEYDPSSEKCWRAFDALFERAGVEKLMEDAVGDPLSAVGQSKSLVEVFEEAGEAGLDAVLRSEL